MNKVVAFCCACCLALALSPMNGTAQEKLAQSGMKFLSVTGDARVAALGEAFTSVEGNSSALFYNPAGMAHLTSLTNVSVGQTRWIADINHSFGSISVSPWEGRYGVIGAFVQAVDYGEFQETVLDYNQSNKDGFQDLGTFSPKGLAVGVGYARALSEQFAVGGVVKYVRQSLGDATVALGKDKAGNTASAYAVDFGVLYRTGYKSLNFGMTVRNFSKELRFINDGFQLPLTFKIGLSMNAGDLFQIDPGMHSFLVTVDAEHPRDFSEQVKVGCEYVFMKMLALRVGYVTPADEHGVSYGVGLQKEFKAFGFGVDYAYTPFGVFGDVHRFTFQFSL